MGTNSYAGLCVGGPLAGKSVAHQHQTMKVQSYNAGKLGAPTTESAIEDFVYNWHHTGAQGFWIPQGESLHDAINTLAVAYVEKCDGRR